VQTTKLVPDLITSPQQRSIASETRTISVFKATAAHAIGADEVGVAESGRSRQLGPIFFPARPEIAAGETAKHRRAARRCAPSPCSV
jgi:hypothetical protein